MNQANQSAAAPSDTLTVEQYVAKQRIVTGVTTTGIPHLGNYVGAIRPTIQALDEAGDAFVFLADYHGIIKCFDPDEIHRSTRAVAAAWLAAGLDPERVVFYRQSDVPEIPELAWILNCSCAKGLMNRAHAYKAAVEMNLSANQANKDPDFGISMGLFGYPVLMAADILMFNASHVPVGKDQIQHIEMARDIAGTFNFKYKELFVLPTAVVDQDTPLLTGLDGRKMSKSYGNTIPLFGDGNPNIDPRKALKKAIAQIVTNSQTPDEPKDPDTCTIFEIYRAFGTADEIAGLADRYRAGIGWGEAKDILFHKIDDEIAPMRERYLELMNDPKALEEILQFGAVKARRHAQKQLDKVRRAIGIRPLAKLK